MIRLYILLLVVQDFSVTHEKDDDSGVTCYINFDIFVPHNGQFCDGTERVNGSLRNGIYFQYKTNINRTWITADIYNATKSVQESVIEFQATDVQFRWIQFDTTGSPVWAIDDIVMDCPNFYKRISFEEDPRNFNKFFTCHSGFLQQETKNCSLTENSLLLNSTTNREIRTITFDLLNDTSEERIGVPILNNCQLQVCLGPSLSYGLVWSTMHVNKTARIQCSKISGSFWTGLYATRKCLDGGVWDAVDVSQCTVKDTNKIAFIVYSTYLQLLDNINSSISTLNQLQQSLDVYNINATISIKLHLEEEVFSVDSVILATYIITFNDDRTLGNNITTLTDVAKYLAAVGINNSAVVSQNSTELFIVYPVDVCQCNNSFTVEEEQQRITMANICVGISLPPCIPDDSDIGSKCNEPYYRRDNTNCVIVNTCSQGLDMQFGIRWNGSAKNVTVTRMCPNGTGITSRLCDSHGKWQVPDVRSCNSTKFHNLFERVCNIASSTIIIDDDELNLELNGFLMDFADTMAQTKFSVFPLDLNTVNNVMGKLFVVIRDNSDVLKPEGMNITKNLLNIFDSIFDGKNEPGYKQLIEIDRKQNQMLITHSERFAMLFAAIADIENDNLTLPKENFVVSVQRSPVRDISLRPQINGHNQTSIHIPAQLLEEKPKDANGMVPVVHVAYKTLHRFLPDTMNLNGQVKELVSMVISIQVGNRNTSSPLPHNNPIILELDHNAPNNNSNMTRCAFWNFDLEHTGGDGGWDSTNVEVAQESHDGHIVCHSLHLTCFVVLVDVSGGSGDQKTEEGTALSVVTYIGCGISMICLLMAILFLIIYRNTLLNGVHNFAHLNLSIAIFLALTVFVAGIETATNNKIACTVVAALLHYLFTAVFSWMLCEGILLYILLVKVFSSNFTKKKWPYFILGWGIPVPIVATAVGIAHRHYGNDEFCWMSTDNGTIWAFAGPMLLIIMVNTVVLLMVLRVLFKSKSQKLTSDEAKQADVVKSLIKATVVLLPLLGVTWVFGLLAVNRNLSVFAWIFTVINSLQGLLILIFHVLRNKKVRGKIATAVVVYTSSLKDQVISTLHTRNSASPRQNNTGSSVKVHIELCEGGTADPVNAMGRVNGSSCHGETLGTYCYERENSQMLSPNWQQQINHLIH